MNARWSLRRRQARTRVLTVLLAMALTVALGPLGCSRRQPATPDTTNAPNSPVQSPVPTTTPPVAEPASPQQPPAATAATVQARIYLVSGEKLAVGTVRTVPAKAPARGALERLLAAPTEQDEAFALDTAIPPGTKLNGVVLSEGTATVDLSERFASGGGSLSMQLRVAQVVSTLTQFPSIERVAFKLDGRPVTEIGGEGLIVSPAVTRADFESVTPAILVENPLPGASVKSPVRITGSSNAFEAQFMVSIADANGRVMAQKSVMATSGSGTRGTFDVSLPYSAPGRGSGTMTAWEPSARDGKPTNVVKIPVRFGP